MDFTSTFNIFKSRKPIRIWIGFKRQDKGQYTYSAKPSSSAFTGVSFLRKHFKNAVQTYLAKGISGFTSVSQNYTRQHY